MIGSDAWFFRACDTKAFPRKGRLVHVQAPDIVDGLRARVASEDEQVGLAEHNGMTVATARSAADHGDNHPLRRGVAIPQIKQV